MAVEILTVSLDDSAIERIAQRVAQYLSNEGVTQSNPPSSETHSTQRGQNVSQGADPWTGEPPADNGSWPQGGQPTQQQPQQGQQQAAQGPVCAHGPMRYVPAGFSKTSGKAYSAFYGCPAPRGATDKCKSVYPN